jgi:hypothetical protein
MKTIRVKSRSTILAYGFYFGVICILVSAVNYAVGDIYNPHWAFSLIPVLVLIGTIIFGILAFKKKNDGYLKFIQGLKIGIGVSVIGTIIIMIYTYAFGAFIEDGFIDKVLAIEEQKMIDRGTPAEQIEQGMKMAKDYFYIFAFGWMFIANLFISFVVSAITTAIVRKEPQR